MPDTQEQTIDQLRGVDDPDRTHLCTACEQYWEPEFFCDECSGMVRNPYYDVAEAMWAERHNESYLSSRYIDADICKNCCTCHLD